MQSQASTSEQQQELQLKFAQPLTAQLATELNYRSQLPAQMQTMEDFSVWAFLKNCIGKELTKITMPVNLNEPLSFLQRLSEYLTHSHLLFQAAAADDHVERLELIAAFAVSAAASNWQRLNKPFNPLLGETYELDRSSDRGYRIVCEQVSHHPPTSAFHAEAVDGSWIFHGSISPRLSFWGKSIEVNPKGYVTLQLLGRDEVYTWHNVQCKIHNVVVGKLWIENFGDMTINCHSSGHKVQLRWHSSSWTGSDCHRVDGYVLDGSGKKLRALYGSWICAMFSAPVESWKSHKHSSGSKRRQHSLLSNGSSKGDTSSGRSSQSDADLADGEESAMTGNSSVADIAACDLQLPGQRLLWGQTLPPDSSEQFYGFTQFTMSLNDNSDQELMSKLPPTDCRLKPDIRALELGQCELAQEEKTRLEEKQRREARAAADADAAEGVWFKIRTHPFVAKQQDWQFDKKYWDRDWSQCKNIFQEISPAELRNA